MDWKEGGAGMAIGKVSEKDGLEVAWPAYFHRSLQVNPEANGGYGISVFRANDDGEKYKMSRAVNSLVTNIQGKQEGYQTIKIIDIMDMIYDDIRKTAQDSYIGKYTNDYDNKCLLITAITGYLKTLESERLLQRGYSLVEIDTEAVKNYQLSNGLYTQEELADMSDQEIKELDTKKKVFLKAKIKILDAMEDIELPISI